MKLSAREWYSCGDGGDIYRREDGNEEQCAKNVVGNSKHVKGRGRSGRDCVRIQRDMFTIGRP